MKTHKKPPTLTCSVVCSLLWYIATTHCQGHRPVYLFVEVQLCVTQCLLCVCLWSICSPLMFTSHFVSLQEVRGAPSATAPNKVNSRSHSTNAHLNTHTHTHTRTQKHTTRFSHTNLFCCHSGICWLLLESALVCDEFHACLFSRMRVITPYTYSYLKF